MKKVILALFLIVGASQILNAQIDFGIKGGVNYNSDSFQEVQTDVLSGSKSKTGFHAGIWTRIKLPILGLYIRPELVYTSLKSEITSKGSNEVATYDFEKIDVPVLLGTKFLKIAHVYAGPSFQYIIDGDFNLASFADEVTTDVSGFTLGVQFGAGIEIGKLGLDVRWERAFSDTDSRLISDDLEDDFNYDTRINQIIVGLSYKF